MYAQVLYEVIEEGAKTLNDLEKNIHTTKMKSPSFKMILATIEDFAFKREDGIE